VCEAKHFTNGYKRFLTCLDHFISKTPNMKIESSFFASKVKMTVFLSYIHVSIIFSSFSLFMYLQDILPSSLIGEYIDNFLVTLLPRCKLLPIIDCIFSEGSSALLRIILSLIRLVVNDIICNAVEITDLTHLKSHMHRLMKSVDLQNILKHAFKSKLIYLDEWSDLYLQYSWVNSIVCPGELTGDSIFTADENGGLGCSDANMEDINWIGFDLDHTLIPYNTHNLDRLLFEVLVLLFKCVLAVLTFIFNQTIQACIKRLIAEKKCHITQADLLEYNEKMAARGVMIDLEYGNILQVTGDRRILRVYHGNALLTSKEILSVYTDGVVPEVAKGALPRFTTIYILGGRALPPLISLCVAKADHIAGVFMDPHKVNYREICAHAKDAFGFAHSLGCKGGYADGLREHPFKYCSEQKIVKSWLSENHKKGHKRFFLVTNSEYYHADFLMKKCFSLTWKKYFDIIVCKANKKSGFFGSVNHVSESMSPPLVEKKKKSWFFTKEGDDDSNDFVKLSEAGIPGERVSSLELGGIYNGGDVNKLMEFMYSGKRGYVHVSFVFV
jgi:hypothetical protein